MSLFWRMVFGGTPLRLLFAKQKEVGATLEGLPKPVWKDNEEQALIRIIFNIILFKVLIKYCFRTIQQVLDTICCRD